MVARKANIEMLSQLDSLPKHMILRLVDVEALTGFKRAAIYALAKQGRFPRPVKLAGGYASGWRVGDIRALLADPSGYRAPRAA